MPTNQVARKRRRPRGVTQNRRNAVATNPDNNHTRRFIYQEQVTLNNALGSNTTYEAYKSLSTLSLQGFPTVARTYDQYRVRRIRVFLQNVLPAVDTAITPAAIFRNTARLPRNANPSVNCMTAVDHTPGITAGANIYAYNNCQFRVPDNDFSTKIADFVPRISVDGATDGIVRPTNNFINCQSNNTFWTGYQIYIVNTGGNAAGSVWGNPLYQQKYLLRYEITIEFKQPIYSITGPVSNTQDTEEKEQDLIEQKALVLAREIVKSQTWNIDPPTVPDEASEDRE